MAIGRKRKKFDAAGSLDAYKKAIFEENQQIDSILGSQANEEGQIPGGGG